MGSDEGEPRACDESRACHYADSKRKGSLLVEATHDPVRRHSPKRNGNEGNGQKQSGSRTDWDAFSWMVSFAHPRNCKSPEAASPADLVAAEVGG